MEISRIPEYLYTADLVSIKDDTSPPYRVHYSILFVIFYICKLHNKSGILAWDFMWLQS